MGESGNQPEHDAENLYGNVVNVKDINHVDSSKRLIMLDFGETPFLDILVCIIILQDKIY